MRILRALPFHKGRPIGLAGRATLYVGALVAAMAIVCTGTVVSAVRTDVVQHAERMATQSAELAAPVMALRMQDGDMEGLARGVRRIAEPSYVTYVAFTGPTGEVVVASGKASDSARAQAVLEARAAGAAGAIVAGDTVWTASPAEAEGRTLGWIVVGVSRSTLEAESLPALAPFLIFFAAFMLIAAPLTVMLVRRRARPLSQLTAFAESISKQGFAGGQIEIKTGDEFEKLANAFNGMIARLEASMRRIQKLAYIDPQTQLPNAERFAREVQAHLARPDAADAVGALIVLDLDRLRKLLETLGHAAAEDLMAQVAERLRVGVRNVDRMVRVVSAAEKPSIIARLRPHEFAVLAPSFDTEQDAARFTQALITSINQPFDWRDLKLTLDCAAGGALAPRDGRDVDTLTRHARLAVSAARKQSSGVRFFAKSMDREAVSRLTLEHDMRMALERGEFRAFFMPKVNLATGRIEAAEALARWVRPDKTIIGPDVFIPAAEETGLIGQLADAITREACWKAAAWAREGLPIQAAVNVSPMQFRDERFPEHVIRILEHAGLPAFCLELEITESAVMEDPEAALRMIEPLRQRGVRFAIDDFGCGHSSLAALTRLPFDVLKIDKQFVSNLDKDRTAPAIIETVLAMAATLDMQVVAEGIEREKDAEFLRRRGCRFGQGFLYGAAEPAAQFGERLRAQRQSVLTRDEESDAA